MKPWFRAGQWLINLGSTALFGLRVEGREKVPKRGGVIIAPNHLSYYDPPLVGSALLKREIYYLTKEELFSSKKFFSWLIRKFNAIPIRRGGSDRKAITDLLELLSRGEAVCIFPEGTRSTGGAPLPPKRGLGYLVLRSRALVVPTFVGGTNYPLRELFLRRRRLRVRFGEPIDPKRFLELGKGSELYSRVGEVVMEEIEKLDR